MSFIYTLLGGLPGFARLSLSMSLSLFVSLSIYHSLCFSFSLSLSLSVWVSTDKKFITAEGADNFWLDKDFHYIDKRN